MELLTNVFDLWIFTRRGTEPTYLLLRTSQEKADRFFGGGRFWQIPGAFLQEEEEIPAVLHRPLAELGLEAESIWAVEHVYPIFNRRFGALQLIPVFAAEVPEQADPVLTWEHSEFGWFTAAECQERLTFRGLLEGLEWTRRHVSEREKPELVFKLP
jgi:NUDIX domain